MIDVEMKIEGIEDVKKALEALPQNIARRVLVAGVREGARLIRAPLREAAPRRSTGGWKRMRSQGAFYRGPGFLQKKITYKYLRRSSSKTEVHYGVGPFGDAFYGFIVAHGHIVGTRKAARGKAAHSLARVKAYDFITPVFQAQYNTVLQRMKSGLEKGIIKEGEKAGFKKSYGWSFP